MTGYGMFWDIPAYAETAAAERRAASSEHQAQRAQQQVRQLEERVDKLSMITAALWMLLKAHEPYLTDERLAQAVEEIDLSDGRLDGRVRNNVHECAACSRPVAPRHDRCIYCGNDIQRGDPFDRVL